MNAKQWVIAALAGAAVLSACTRRPPATPPPEPVPQQAPIPIPPPIPADTVAVIEPSRRAVIQERVTAVFRPVYFAFDQSTLSAEARATAEAIGRVMLQYPEISLRIEGHADERGTNEYNLALGERRARAVQSYLTSYGVSANRITIVSYGEERPAAAGSNEAAWALNRRAEFVATY